MKRFSSPRRFSAPLLATVVVAVCVVGAIAVHVLRPHAAKQDEPIGAAQLPASEPIAMSPPMHAAPDARYPDIEWTALLPKGWDPMAPFKGLRIEDMDDADPRAQVALYNARKYWKHAPTEPSLDGKAVRLPGYVVSLDGEGEAIREFLLVPYFGACIHVPPPPANQVVHVRARQPLPGIRTMDTVWISGVMRIEQADTMFGMAGYAMHDATLEPYNR